MLDRVVSSETFRRSERARSLLAYLVGREQAGDGERLKGYAIAVDVFGRDAEFDASTDALVRVQAGRLRELLAQYYEGEGGADPMRIAIPRGSYVPEYEKVAPCPTLADAPSSPDAVQRSSRGVAPGSLPARPEQVARPAERLRSKRPAVAGQLQLLWGALALVAALLVVLVYRTAPLDRTAAAVAPGVSERTAADLSPSLPQGLPTISIVTVGDDPAVASVAHHFRAAFAGFDTLDTIDGEFSAGESKLPPEPAGFVLSIAEDGAPGAVSIDLQSLGSGKVLLNRSLSAAETSGGLVGDKVANIATAVAPVTGVIYGYLRQSGLNSPLVECLALSDAYFTDQTAVRHAAAYKCLEQLANQNSKSPLVYAELSSLHMEARTDGYAYPAGATDEQAMMLARKGVQLGPTSPYAHRAMGFVYSRTGDSTESVRWMRKAYQLNTYDLSMAASYGYALVFSADYREGAAILQRAVEASSAHPTWWDYSLFLARFMLDEMDDASRATDALVSPRKSHYLAARLIAAHWRGDERRAGSLASELVAAYPKFAADPGSALKDAKYPADLTGKLVGALRSAGLGAS